MLYVCIKRKHRLHIKMSDAHHKKTTDHMEVSLDVDIKKWVNNGCK